MKIIFITREGYELPGARIRCYNFAKELSRYGIDTEVLSFSDTLGAKDGADESRMDLKDKAKLNFRAFKKLIKEKKSVFYIQRLNYHSFAPYLSYLLNRNKIIFDLDDWEIRENPKYYFGFYPSSKAYHFTREIAKNSIFCIAASRFLEEFLLQFNRKVYYIPSGVDTDLFCPSSGCLGVERIIFSWIGTLHRKEYVENIDFALGCFSALRKKYSHIYFEIVGGGIYRKNLESIISQYNDKNILFKGWFDHRDIPGYLATIHIGLMPVFRTTKFNLAKSPTKLFEYMAMSKPTISSQIGESANIISDGKNGLLATTKKEFIEKMCYLVKNVNARKLIGEEASESVREKYSLSILGKQLYKILDQAFSLS